MAAPGLCPFGQILDIRIFPLTAMSRILLLKLELKGHDREESQETSCSEHCAYQPKG